MTKASFEYHYGEFSVFGTYIKTTAMKDEEPAMAIGGKRFDRKTAWVIPLSAAYLYADSTSGAPTEYLVETSRKIANLLGIEGSRGTVFKIASAIVDALPMLIQMPPREDPTAKQVERAIEQSGLRVRVNGNTVLDAS